MKMKYMLCAYLIMICYIHHGLAIKSNSINKTQFVNSKSSKNSNEKYINHNMDGWIPIMPTLEYLQLQQRKNCVSVGYYNTECGESTESPKKPINNSKYKSIVDLFNRDYRSPYGNYVADIVPKLPNHYTNPIPRYPYTDRRQYRRFSTNSQSNIELPRFIQEEPTTKFGNRSFQRSVTKYQYPNWRDLRRFQQYPMFEPIPGQTLYPPTVPQFKPNPLNKIPPLQFRYDNNIAHSRTKGNIKTIKSTIYPFFEHEAITKKPSKLNNQNVKNSSRFDITSPAFSMVIEPTTIKVSSSSTTNYNKPTIKTLTTIVPPIQYVYSVAAKHSKNNNFSMDYGFEKELPRKVVIESPPKLYSRDESSNNDVISSKLNRFLEYTTSGYSVYVTIKPLIERPDKKRTELMENEPMTNKKQKKIKIIPLLYPQEDNNSYSNYGNSRGNSIDKNDFKFAIKSGHNNSTYFAKNTGFKKIINENSTKTTIKPIIYTLSSLLLDTDNQSSSHQLSKSGQYYVDHLSSTIINIGETRATDQPASPSEALRSSITIKHQPLLPNKSNNQNTTNSRWTQPHELYAINNNDGINDRDQKIKDINLDIVITTDGPTTSRNQIYKNENYLGINDGDEWNDGNVDGNSRVFSGYGRVNVEPNIEWIMVAKSSKLDDRKPKSRSIRLMSSSYRDFIIPMTKKEMPKFNNSDIVLGTQFLVQ